MKRLFLLSLLFLCMNTVTAKGQAALLVLIFGEKAATDNFYFSLKAGVNCSVINGVEEGDMRWGPSFGLVNNIRLNDRFFLAPEFLALSPRGVRNAPTLTTGRPELDSLLVEVHTSDRRLNYMDIPVLIRMQLGKRWRVSAGPQLSILTSASDIYRPRAINDVVLTTEVDIRDEISRIELGAVLDLNYVVSKAHGGKGLNLYIRYTQGFTDLSTGEGSPRHTSSLFQFGAAFPFIEKAAAIE